MNARVLTHNCALSPLEQQALDRHVDRLERMALPSDGDGTHLEVAIGRPAFSEAFSGQLRLVLGERFIAVHRTGVPDIRLLLDLTFGDLHATLWRGIRSTARARPAPETVEQR